MVKVISKAATPPTGGRKALVLELGNPWPLLVVNFSTKNVKRIQPHCKHRHDGSCQTYRWVCFQIRTRRCSSQQTAWTRFLPSKVGHPGPPRACWINIDPLSARWFLVHTKPAINTAMPATEPNATYRELPPLPLLPERPSSELVGMPLGSIATTIKSQALPKTPRTSIEKWSQVLGSRALKVSL
jgi:hypothetical protein